MSGFTLVATWAGFVYVAFIIYAFARRIVGWLVSRTVHGFVLDALEQALHERRLYFVLATSSLKVPTPSYRSAYEDWLEIERKRHLLRLWLSPPGARPLPPVLAECYGDVTIGDRGRIICGRVSNQRPERDRRR